VLAQKLADYKRFSMAVANFDVPRIQALVSMAMCSGTSISTITQKIHNAFCGLYRPKSFGENDIASAILVLRIGGRNLLWVLSQSHGLPSIRTIYNRMNFT
jgi:uncharacterized protein YoaH (UPF0181 family)